jgi:GNAT superfamily N-acetyltransferase
VKRRGVTYERRRGEFLITTDARRFDIDAIHAFLSVEAYWCQGIPKPVLEKAIANSLSFGLLEEGRQVGFARVVSDRATFAWICDVYVLADYRGRGLGSWLIESVLAHPDMQGLRRIVLATRDAHELYRRAGFVALPMPERWMAIADAAAYARRAGDA